MNLNSVVPVSEGAKRVGCSPAIIRSLIRSGELPATRVGHQWFIEESSLERVSLRDSFSGRTLSQRLAWSLLADLEGRAFSFALHRQEQARLGKYGAQSHEQLCRRLRGRASFISLSATSSSITRLRSDPRWVIGGSDAVARYLNIDGLVETSTFYARKSLEEDFLDASLAVPDEFAPNLYLALVDDAYWPFDSEIDHYVWGSVAYLDCREQRVEGPQMALLWPPRTGNLDVFKVGAEQLDVTGEAAGN